MKVLKQLTLLPLCSLVMLTGCSTDSPENHSLKITDVTYDAAATYSQAVTSISSITLLWDGKESEVIDFDQAARNATLTVDGVEYDIIGSLQSGRSYEYADRGKTGISLTAKGAAETGFSKFDGNRIDISYYTRTAAWIDGAGLNSDYSVTNAIIGGNTDSQASQGATINSQGGFFSGYYIDGADYKISDLNMTLKGYGGDDFQGWGAGINITGNSAHVSIDKAYIDTTGVIRTGIWVGGRGGSSLDVTDTVVVAKSDTEATAYSPDDNYAVPMMEKVPFALGLQGNIRATNVLGNATASYSDSIVVANGWGALSTDSGQKDTVALEVNNVLSGIGNLEVAKVGVDSYSATKEVNGITYGFTLGGSGYVTYADSGIIDNFTNVEFYAPDYIGIIASNTSTMNFRDSYGYSDRIGFMSHQTKGGNLNIEGGKFDVADTFVMIKSGAANNGFLNVNVDGAEINLFGTAVQSGVLVQLMESDDTGGGPGAVSCPIEDNTLDEIRQMTSRGEIQPSTASFANVDLKGDIYNSVYRFTQALNVSLTDSKLEGVISSSVVKHVDESGNQFNNAAVYAQGFGGSDAPEDGRLYLGRVVNEATESVNNGVTLKLSNSTWTVTGTSYLNSLALENGASIVAPAGYSLSMTVNGKSTKIEDGKTYAGNIRLSLIEG